MVRLIFTDFLDYRITCLTASGLNTGFGGSANRRTKNLKRELLDSLLYDELGYRSSTSKLQAVLPLDHTIKMSMPESWTRAAILIRINSLSQGASGVLFPTVQALKRLLYQNVLPRISLRGSISVSDDLSPLAYIAGLMEG